MAKLMYQCPRTGVNVDIWLADAVAPVSADTYEHVMCPSCAHIHFINKSLPPAELSITHISGHAKFKTDLDIC